MKPKSRKVKSVALCFRGFDLSPEQVESIVGRIASEKGCKGEPVRLGVKTLLVRSFARFSIELPDTSRLDEIIPILLSSLGGISHLNQVREQISPEFLDIGITLPVKGSDDQEGGFLSPETLAYLSMLHSTLSFEFI